jgi:hypothetical protein
LSQASSDDFRLVSVDFPKPELLLFEIAMGEVKSAALQEGNGKGDEEGMEERERCMSSNKERGGGWIVVRKRASEGWLRSAADVGRGRSSE